eukprot:scaffold137646_cov28-Tisochrysis_lutea.AAC.2
MSRPASRAVFGSALSEKILITVSTTPSASEYLSTVLAIARSQRGKRASEKGGGGRGCRGRERGRRRGRGGRGGRGGGRGGGL